MISTSGYAFKDNLNLYSSLILSALINDDTAWSATEIADLKCYIQAPIAIKVEIAAYTQSLLSNVTPSVHQSGKAVKFLTITWIINTLLQARAQSKVWKLGIKFEFTRKDTPQRNDLAELP